MALLTVAEAAERMRISPSLVYELCAAGEIAHLRLGRPGKRGTIRIPEDAVEKHLRGCRREGPQDDGEFVYLK